MFVILTTVLDSSRPPPLQIRRGVWLFEGLQEMTAVLALLTAVLTVREIGDKEGQVEPLADESAAKRKSNSLSFRAHVEQVIAKRKLITSTLNSDFNEPIEKNSHFTEPLLRDLFRDRCACGPAKQDDSCLTEGDREHGVKPKLTLLAHCLNTFHASTDESISQCEIGSDSTKGHLSSM